MGGGDLWDIENILLTLEPVLRETVGVKGERFLGRDAGKPGAAGISTQHWGLPGCPSLPGTLSRDKKELWDGGQVRPDLPASPRTPQQPV